ncbi:MAG: hypothetical protein ACRELC_08145 [Gemmatimonadota bacterium]
MVLVGDEAFLDEQTSALPALTEVPRSHWRPLRPPLEEILSPRNDAAIAHAYREHAYTMREIAAQLGVHYATVSRRLGRHETRML